MLIERHNARDLFVLQFSFKTTKIRAKEQTLCICCLFLWHPLKLIFTARRLYYLSMDVSAEGCLSVIDWPWWSLMYYD